MKIIMTAAILFASFTSLHAQNLSFGPTAGFGHSAILVKNNHTTYDNKFWPSYNAGLKLVYSFVPNWGMSADVKFSGEGGKNRFTTVGNDLYQFEYRANYIRIPVQAIYFFGDLGDAVRPKISLGPSVGFLIGGTTEAKINNGVDSKPKIEDVIEGFDFGLTGAFGANFKLGGGKWLNTDIAYYHGLTNLAKDPAVSAKNRNIGINIGITFPMGTATPAK